MQQRVSLPFRAQVRFPSDRRHVRLQVEAAAIDGHMAGVDPIGNEELAEGQEAQQQIQLEDVKVARDGCDDEHFGQIHPIRPSEPDNAQNGLRSRSSTVTGTSSA